MVLVDTPSRDTIPLSKRII
jgi:hypothetical protein